VRLKEKSAGEIRIVPPCRAGQRGAAMNFPHFLRIERDGPDRPQHLVVHTAEPKFLLELAPDRSAPDQIGQGLIKRICVPNSWAGDYGECSKLFGVAQEFFSQSLAAPVSKAGMRRFPT
jgi:hypothetical protein